MKQDADLSALSSKELIALEREIAKKHLGHVPWLAIVWSLANFAVWLSLWPLVLLDVIPLWLGFLVATANLSLSYLPSHEAQHDIIARPGERLRWLNELVGWIGSIPLVVPYPVLKATHIEHHTHANDPERDPDYFAKATSPWHALWRHFQARQPRGDTQSAAYLATLRRIGRADLIVPYALAGLGYYGFLFAMAWSGHALEAALLWWLPHHIGYSYILFFLAWAPHFPGKQTGRYRDTRAWRSHLGNVLSMGMQFHIVHHLHPRIPLYRTPAAYWEMKPVLKARGCELGDL